MADYPCVGGWGVEVLGGQIILGERDGGKEGGPPGRLSYSNPP